MAVNSEKEGYQTMIEGLARYISSLQEYSQTLKMAGETYDEGVNDRTSHVYRSKIEKLCKRIDPVIIEEVNNLKKNLEEQLAHIIWMEEQNKKAESE